ncbi:MAG TPA: hypothetical protein VH418_19955 [Solirubrobacteraceae bacterium]|jgi:hypothetical protein
MSEPERELEDMQEQSERLKHDIEGVRADWERKQADEHVPGATGEPEPGDEESEGPPPEAEYPSKADSQE